MGPLGWPETVFIVVLALLLFGPKKLPELGRTLGKAITEFRRASAELKSTFGREMRNLEREAEAVKEKTTTKFHDSYNYDYSSYDTGTPYPDATAADTHSAALESAPEPVSAYPHQGASAPEGAPSTAAESRPLTVTPAPGTFASGSFSQEHHAGGGPAPVPIPDRVEAAQDKVTS